MPNSHLLFSTLDRTGYTLTKERTLNMFQTTIIITIEILMDSFYNYFVQFLVSSLKFNIPVQCILLIVIYMYEKMIMCSCS